MNVKRVLLYLLFLAPGLLSGAAFGDVLDDPAKMALFFKDKEMRRIVLFEDFRAFFMGAPFDVQDAMKAACRDTAKSNRHTELCVFVRKLTLPD